VQVTKVNLPFEIEAPSSIFSTTKMIASKTLFVRAADGSTAFTTHEAVDSLSTIDSLDDMFPLPLTNLNLWAVLGAIVVNQYLA
jgi:hypothetical protein